MSGKWILACKNKSFELSNTFYHKNWSENTHVGAEAIALLELLEVVQRKGRNISSGRLVIGLANSKVHRRIKDNILKSTTHTQDAGAMISQIRRILQTIKF